MALNEMFAGENKNIEYKRELPDKSDKYMKTVVAFANSGGGSLVFGVEDQTLQVAGIPEEQVFHTMDRIANAISDSCTPLIVPDISLQTVGDKTVIIVQIYPGGQRPYFIKSLGKEQGTYVRISGTSRPADTMLIKELEFEGTNRYYDQTYAVGHKAVEQDIRELCSEMKAYALKRCKNEMERQSVKDIDAGNLLSWGILLEREGKIFPSNAYVLLTNPSISEASIQCAVFKGNTRKEFIDRREYTGPIYKQIDEAYEFVLRNIHYGSKIEGLQRSDSYELPVDCIREMIANAVTHRSYLSPGSVQVAVYDDRLEVTSPGMLFNGLSLESIKRGLSRPRNRAIAFAFSYMKIIESWGSGIPRMIDTCREMGIREPEFEELGIDFRVNLYRKGTPQTTQGTPQATQGTPQATQGIPQAALRNILNSEELTDQDKELLTLIINSPSLSQKAISLELGWSVDRVKYYMKKLKRNGVIGRVGSSQKGHWMVITSEGKR